MNNGETNIVGAICARGGSKGVPRKNLRPLAGEPLIAHAIRCAKASSTLRRVVVSTDDHAIAGTAKEYGAEVPFIRPAHLALDDTSKWPVFQHLVEAFEHATGERVDVLVDLDAGVPLRKPSDIDGCVNQLLSGTADIVATAYEADRNPYFNMVELKADGLAKIVKSPEVPIVCRQAAPPVYSLSPAVYAIRRDTLWKYSHWSEARFQIYRLPRERAIDIDSELDFRLVEFLMLHQGTNYE
jgi:CMP-N,N'-diacetyllegionaminic acid synthase